MQASSGPVPGTAGAPIIDAIDRECRLIRHSRLIAQRAGWRDRRAQVNTSGHAREPRLPFSLQLL
jgi:hypothetical protein